jgi:SAM-dependent methyltransferase
VTTDPTQPEDVAGKRRGSGMVRDVVVAKAIEDLRPGTALDLGCGTGANTLMLARGGWQATGVDISAGAIRLAQGAAREAGLNTRFITADILTWEPDTQYDLVLVTYALPGGARSHTVMGIAIRALKPGGTLIAVEWDHSMAERWNMDPDDLPSPSDLATMVPGLVIEAAESRTIADMLRDDPDHAGVDATIAYLRAHRPHDTEERTQHAR